MVKSNSIISINGCFVPVDGNEVYVSKIEALSPITANENKVYSGNALLFHNKGNTVVTFDNNFTINPGDFLPISNPGTYDIFIQKFNFKFSDENIIDDGEVIKRIEVLKTYYIKQKI